MEMIHGKNNMSDMTEMLKKQNEDKTLNIEKLEKENTNLYKIINE